MDTNALKKFAQAARNLLIDQVTARLDLALAQGGAARREYPKAVQSLEAACATNRGQVIEQAAYAWFNRFTALRFMDATGLTNPRVVSPADGATRPEILAEALAGNLPDGARPEIAEYLNGTRPAHDPQAEAYRLLLIHACNHWHGPMPFMFERAEDYSELLMPDDLLSPDSILARLRAVMTTDACADVEIIGWLYQFYISEKKDQVFAGLKKNVKITAENIPAATQLFTPHWIVRYLVENSLGRLWLLNRPASKLALQMEYYIAPEEPETDFLRLERPEDIRICDPACGSGHMLTYAFDLLHAIYAEEGYDADAIPALILTHNLHGVEIDDRAGALAAFALVMKAAARLGRRKFLRLGVQPNICVMQDVRFSDSELDPDSPLWKIAPRSDALVETLRQFEAAKNFGSLIVPKLRDPAEVARVVRLKEFGGDLLLRDVQERVLKVLEMAEALSPKYHVVVANPPYMGWKGMNLALQGFARSQYSDSRSDLFAMFMERASTLSKRSASVAMINMQSWMFLSSFEKLRGKLLSKMQIASMAHLGERGFDTIGGSVVSTTAFVFINATNPKSLGDYFRLTSGSSEAEKSALFRKSLSGTTSGVHYRYSSEMFQKVLGSPIAYWITEDFRELFSKHQTLASVVDACQGMSTADNDRFVRQWHEVVDARFARPLSENFSGDQRKWFAYDKGGEYRRWFGNNSSVVMKVNDGSLIKSLQPKSVVRNEQRYFQSGVTWGKITSGPFSARFSPEGAIFSDAGMKAFPKGSEDKFSVLGFFNSCVAPKMLSVLSETINFEQGNIARLPVVWADGSVARQLSENSKSDWDAYETSWDFTTLPLLAPEHRAETLAASYAALRAHWQGITDEMQRLEEENNRIFIDAYGLSAELTPEVPPEEITLTCNPAYRYGGKATAEELETRLRADTMAEFLHYAVGCMFGRYSLDAPGLILANQGEGPADYRARVPEPTSIWMPITSSRSLTATGSPMTS